MKNPPTLIDALFGETFHKAWKSMDPENWLRTHLLKARRFVLDDSMSAFMADLAYASLPVVRNAKRDQEVIDGMRVLARLPHAVTWIEYNMTARIKRANEAYGTTHDWSKSPTKGGWLFVQHPKVETAFLAVETLSHSTSQGLGEVDIGAPLIPVPSAHFINWTWCTDAGPLPGWLYDNVEVALPRPLESYLTGIATYKSDCVGIVGAPYLVGTNIWKRVNKDPKIATSWLEQSASDMRYAWALLAAINDTPTTAEVVRPSKGYVARGRYRKFLEHTVIKLKIPGKVDLRTLAKRVTRLARRRAHMVRGHWRKNWRKPEEKLWITEHQRGDASLGFVTHDYAVTHGDQPDGSN